MYRLTLPTRITGYTSVALAMARVSIGDPRDGSNYIYLDRLHPSTDAFDKESSDMDVNRVSPRTKAWIRGVPLDIEAAKQIHHMQNLHRHGILNHSIAVMPDAHSGVGATVGTVIPTYKAIIPSAVGVDIGCGMVAVRTTLCAEDLPESLFDVRLAVECAIPHGRTHNGRSDSDVGGWRARPSKEAMEAWNKRLRDDFRKITSKYPRLERSNNINHLGTLGTGNHFIELCLDEKKKRFGSCFIVEVAEWETKLDLLLSN